MKEEGRRETGSEIEPEKKKDMERHHSFRKRSFHRLSLLFRLVQKCKEIAPPAAQIPGQPDAGSPEPSLIWGLDTPPGLDQFAVQSLQSDPFQELFGAVRSLYLGGLVKGPAQQSTPATLRCAIRSQVSLILD